MLHVDGSQKSGSGTIFRTALVMAALLGEEIELVRIRAGREKPGIQPQHLEAARAVCQMTRGSLSGDYISSNRLHFKPERLPSAGSYLWDIGTAGSTTLLATTVLPLALTADGPCTFELTGGVFQDFAPSGYHTRYCLLPMLARMGVKADLEVVRPGYYPKGGGLLRLRVEPLEDCLHSFQLTSRGKHLEIWGVSLSSHLSDRKVSDRMAEQSAQALRRRGLSASIRIIEDHTAAQPGAALCLIAEDEAGSTLGSDVAGARGRPSEKIAEAVVRNLWRDLQSGATVDRHLSDQLVLYAALAQETTEYLIPALTDHVESSLWLAESLLKAEVKLEGRHLKVKGIGYRPRRRSEPFGQASTPES